MVLNLIIQGSRAQLTDPLTPRSHPSNKCASSYAVPSFSINVTATHLKQQGNVEGEAQGQTWVWQEQGVSRLLFAELHQWAGISEFRLDGIVSKIIKLMKSK